MSRLQGSPTLCSTCLSVKHHRRSFPKQSQWKANDSLVEEGELSNPSTLRSSNLELGVRQRKIPRHLRIYVLGLSQSNEYAMCNPVKNPTVPREKLRIAGDGVVVDPTKYKQLIGSLMYITTTRPDIMFIVCLLSRHIQSPTKQHLLVVKRILRCLKGMSGHPMYLVAECRQEQPTFGLFVETTSASGSCTLDFEILVMNKSSYEFTRQAKVNNLKVAILGWGWSDLFRTPWKDFMSEKSEYFINGILHLRVHLTLAN
ncbi:hypothetical protein V2J09_021988 [Rumex salicifolius]